MLWFTVYPFTAPFALLVKAFIKDDRNVLSTIINRVLLKRKKKNSERVGMRKTQVPSPLFITYWGRLSSWISCWVAVFFSRRMQIDGIRGCNCETFRLWGTHNYCLRTQGFGMEIGRLWHLSCWECRSLAWHPSLLWDIPHLSFPVALSLKKKRIFHIFNLSCEFALSGLTLIKWGLAAKRSWDFSEALQEAKGQRMMTHFRTNPNILLSFVQHSLHQSENSRMV